jgi:hypothetical protein
MSGYPKYSFLTSTQQCGHPNADGAGLVFHSRFVDLDEQVRAEDPAHAAFVEKLHKRKPITLDDLQSYSILSDKDYRNANSPWYTAPIIVPINRDRFNIIHSSAIRYAQIHNTSVLRWRCKDAHYEQKPSEEYMEYIYNNDPCFWEYFIVNAPGSINKTINKKLNLVNAMKCWQYSITMESEELQRQVEDLVANSPPGSVIDIPCPLSVNIRIDPEYFTSNQLRVLRQFSIFASDPDTIYGYNSVSRPSSRSSKKTAHNEAGDGGYYSDTECQPTMPATECRRPLRKRGIRGQPLVIPILKGTAKSRERVQGYGTQDCQPFRVTIQQRFPIDLDFAMTVNRSQGQTLENVILAISKRSLTSCDFKYNGIYVAFSRVKSKKNIRLLLVGNSEASKWESIRYITELKPDPFCSAVISGWSRKGGDGWINNEWSSVESRRAYTKSVPKKRKVYPAKQARYIFK